MKEEYISGQEPNLLASYLSESAKDTLEFSPRIANQEQRKTCQSAAVIGLALSLGTTSIFWGHQQEAVAATYSTLPTNSVPNFANLDELNANYAISGGLTVQPDPLNFLALNSAQSILLRNSLASWSLVRPLDFNQSSFREKQLLSHNLGNQNSQTMSTVTKSDHRSWQQQQQIVINNLKDKHKRLIDGLAKLKQNSSNLTRTSLGQQSQPQQPPKTESAQPVLLSQQPEAVSNTHKRNFSALKAPSNQSESQTNVVIKSNLEAASTNTIPRLPPLAVAPTKSSKDIQKQIYIVKPGDSLENIALSHNVSRAELIEANKLNNPDLILVNQHLLIPTASQTENESVKNASSERLPTESIKFQQAEAAFEAQAETKSETQKTVINQSPQQPESADPYIAKLRAEIVRLREQYRQQAGGGQITTPTQAIKDNSSEANSTTATAERNSIHPEWQKYRLSDADSASDQPNNRKPQLPQLPKLSTEAKLVSTTSSRVDNYNHVLRPAASKSVVPQLPPLSSPENYLPDSSAEFDGYMWPAKGAITSGYGWRWGRMHKGIDIAGPVGTPIFAAAGGEVIFAGWNSGGYGNLVKVRHPDGSVTLYAHNNRIIVRQGQWVEKGEQIAEMGSTGYSTGPHLHFEIRPNGKSSVDPIVFLPQE